MNPAAVSNAKRMTENMRQGSALQGRHDTYVRGRMASQSTCQQGDVECIADLTLWLVRRTRIPGRTIV